MAQSQVNVLTYQYDNSRTGQNLSETILTPANVNSTSFGKLFTHSVDGQVFSQPLYVSHVKVGGSFHNLLIVTTEHDGVYAFDADNNVGTNSAPLWQTSFLNAAAGITSVPDTDFTPGGVGNIAPEVGITGTPVIALGAVDSSGGNTGIIYVVAKTKQNGAYYETLHALNLTTGLDAISPVVCTADVIGTGDGAYLNADGKMHVAFNALKENQRCGLVLSGNTVTVVFTSHGDITPYHGWVLNYDATTLQQTGVYNTTPNGSDGGIWMAGAAPAVDSSGNIYYMTGNGTFNVNTGGTEYGDTFQKLSPSLAPLDYFTPMNQNYMSVNDIDLGSGGPMLLPDSAGSATYPHLLIGCGKTGNICLIDRDNMGGYSLSTNNVVQQVGSDGIWSNPAYWNGYFYYQGKGAALKQFSIVNGVMSSAPLSQSADTSGYPGCTPIISANGTTNGIVWTVQNDTYYTSGTEILHAHNATNVNTELYNSNQNLARDNPGNAIDFCVPTVANGKVYVGAQYQVDVYGLLNVQNSPPTASSQSVTTVLNKPLAITLTGTDSNTPALPLTYTVTSAPLYGTLSGTAPNLTYTPASGYLGSDSFSFKVNNGKYDSAVATISIGVNITSLTNGSFETPSVGAGGFVQSPPGSGWMLNGVSGIQANGSLLNAPNAPDGTQTAFLECYQNMPIGSISQSVTFPVAGTYKISFQAAQWSGGYEPVQVSVDGVNVGGQLSPASTNFGLLTSATFTIASAGAHTIALAATINNGTLVTMVDLVTITPVSLITSGIVNGSFETPSVGTAGQQYNPVGATWTFLGDSGIQSNGSGWGVPNAPDGTQTAFLNGNPNRGTGNLGNISQSVNFTTTGTYVVSFQGARRQGQVQPLKLSVDGVQVGGLLTPSGSTFGPVTSGIFTISTTGLHTITLSATATTSDLTTMVDSVTLTPVTVATSSFANASFETPSVGTASQQYNPVGASWTFLGDSGIQSNGSGWGVPNAPDGTQTAFLNGNPNRGTGNLGNISQSVNFTTTGTYVVSFQGARRQGQVQPLKLSVDGVQVGGLLTPSGSTFGPVTSGVFTISTTGLHTITLSATATTSDLTTMVDSVTLTPVTVATSSFANASFETPSLGAASQQYNPVGATWTFLGDSGIQSNGSGWGVPNAPDGTQTAFLNGNPNRGTGNLGNISQSVNFASTGNYTISFQGARRQGQVQPLMLTVDGVQVGGLLTPSGSTFGPVTSNVFTISTIGVHTITLSATATTSDLTTMVDQVTLNAQ